MKMIKEKCYLLDNTIYYKIFYLKINQILIYPAILIIFTNSLKQTYNEKLLHFAICFFTSIFNF